jgi:alpha-beta hydrolase superfamily lysophospholipase
MITLAILIAIIYLVICVGFYFFQHLLFLRPERLSPSFEYKYPFPFEELDFEMEDGGVVNAIYFKVPNSRGVVYYMKGNSKSIKGWGKFAKDFLSNGYDFFMMDYRGFGKSRGKRTQANVFNDSQFIYKWLRESYPEDKIILYGRSWGSGIAARIASWNKPKLLILDSPYYSFYHTIHRYLFFVPLRLILRYDIRTDQYLETIACPVHIIHGTKDRLIPFSNSEKLKTMFPEKVTLHSIPGAKHNNLPEYSEFFEILYKVLYVNPEHSS